MKYNIITSQTDYNSLIDVIPVHWKKWINGKRPQVIKKENIVTNNMPKAVSEITCKHYYWEFIKFISQMTVAEGKCKKYFNIDDTDWPKYYQLLYQIIQEILSCNRFSTKSSRNFPPVNAHCLFGLRTNHQTVIPVMK
jgi:hypothetical protein